MTFNILHRSSKRFRVRASFRCTVYVQEYLVKLAADFHKIKHIHFYNDMFSFAIIIDEEGNCSFEPDESLFSLEKIENHKRIYKKNCK